MKTTQDLKLEYRQETGLEPIITAYGFRPYLAWLEEKTLKLSEAEPLLEEFCKLTEFGPLQGNSLYARVKAFLKH